jgi:hypothetical protein
MDDPVVARLLRQPTGLKAGGLPSAHEVLATYWMSAGTASFAFCRHGLLLNPGGQERYIPFLEIEDAGYYNRELIGRAKAARTGDGSVDLVIRLCSGETIELALERRDEKIPDVLTIANLIRQRMVIHRAEERRAAMSGDLR